MSDENKAEGRRQKAEILEGLPRLRVLAEADLAALQAAAAADGHDKMQLPTHVVMKGAEICGCMAIGSVPLVHSWVHTGKMSARDTALVAWQMENEAARRGFRMVTIPIPEESPLLDQMEKHFGYTRLGTVTLFGKKTG